MYLQIPVLKPIQLLPETVFQTCPAEKRVPLFCNELLMWKDGIMALSSPSTFFYTSVICQL